jgi:hypothetical protein
MAGSFSLLTGAMAAAWRFLPFVVFGWSKTMRTIAKQFFQPSHTTSGAATVALRCIAHLAVALIV